ncbi:hypothetical protein BDB00DRAFT_802838 [Zychaea mexicana]|uniref:uncharacterized protein n=1 Tax=Zychaea mexicana TaxID=64656 RepID=UPI0022FE000B|nr:uncharacterized protein BDB00DRAFT_802838 [Zychaea mexicana]KAI9497969.1 hypothetical protein BDB00DRAFT_802838 [Zychaea mexicana]
MNPRQCSIILVDGCTTHQDATISTLNQLHGDVEIVSTGYDALTALHSRQKKGQFKKPTLLLIDVENIDRNINVSSKAKECLGLIKTVTNELKQGSLHDAIPIVCSCSEDPEFMLECLRNGAADYIVKPLESQVIKTLFLNVYRYRISSARTGTVPPSMTVTSPPAQDPGKVWPFFQDRLKSVFMNENWLQNTIYNYYAPEPSVRRSSMSSMSSEKTMYLRSRICSWDFLPLDVEEKDLVKSVCLILQQVLDHPDLADFRVSDDDMYAFVFDICNSYHNNNPYHNFRHAVDVMQSTYYFLCKMGVLMPMDNQAYAAFSMTRGGAGYTPTSERKRSSSAAAAAAASAATAEGTAHHYNNSSLSPSDSAAAASAASSGSSRKASSNHEVAVADKLLMQDLLKPMDILALLMASLGHDVGHPGVTNMFMVQSGTPLAVLYNDRSVLESYHSMAFFHLLGQSCFRKLIDVKQNPGSQHFRKFVVQSILATDMSMHDDYVQRIEHQADRLRNHGIDLDNESAVEQERLTVCGALIKCADIGNCARPFPLAKKWAEILTEEFARQGDLEKELGLQVLPINERGKVSLEEFQLTFERKIALKLYNAVARVLPGMKFCLDFINENIDTWENNQALDSGVGRSEPNTDVDDDEEEEEDHGEQKTIEDNNDDTTPAAKQDIKIAPYHIASTPLTKNACAYNTHASLDDDDPRVVDYHHPLATNATTPSTMTSNRRKGAAAAALCHCSIQ